MYTLVVADDDQIILQGLKENIPWRQYGFSLLAAVSNGRQVLDIVKRHDVDVILSDINMPFMNGLEMARYIHELNPTVKVILLTGYDDFAYIQDAFQLNVFDYLLKPVNAEKLQSTLARLQWELDSQRTWRQRVESSLPVLRERFLSQLLNGSLPPAAVQEQSALLDIPFAFPRFLVVVLHMPPVREAPAEESDGARSLLQCGVQMLLHELFDAKACHVCACGKDSLALIANFSETDAAFVPWLHRQIQALHDRAGSYLTIGVGDAHSGYEGIVESYQEARYALRFKNIYGENQVFFVQDTGGRSDDSRHPFALLRPRMDEGEDREPQARIRRLKAELIQFGCADPSFLRFAALHCMGDLHAALCKGPQEEDVFLGYQQLLFDFYIALEHAETADGVFSILEEYAGALRDIAGSNKLSERERLVAEAKEYLRTRYVQPGIKQSDVAKHLFTSPSYLSTLFKQSTGVSFNEYLLRLRITEAERLLRETDLKIYEIAERVGFINEQYFSSCYKRITGHSPSKRRGGAGN